MKNRLFTNLVALGLVMGATTVAMAGGPDMSAASEAAAQQPVANASGLYLGADLGYGAFNSGSKVGEFNTFAKSLGAKATDSGVVFGAHVGYDINRYVAAQVSYLYLPKINFSYDSSSVNVYNNMLAVEAKGMFPLMSDKLVPFATAGYAVIFTSPGDSNVDTKATNWEPVFGAGMEYKVTPHIGVNAQYKVVTNFNNKFSTVNMGLAGLNYYF